MSRTVFYVVKYHSGKGYLRAHSSQMPAMYSTRGVADRYNKVEYGPNKGETFGVVHEIDLDKIINEQSEIDGKSSY